ncbi:hypothetical protein ACOSQ4_013625 [Xanthoceras sorbifolium]
MHFLDRSAEAMLTINKRSTLASPIKELFPHDGIAGSWCNFKFFLKNTTAGVKHREVNNRSTAMHFLDRSAEAMLTINKRSTLASSIKELFPHDGIAGSWCNFKIFFEKHRPKPSPEKSPEKSPDRPLEPPVRPCAMVTPPAHQSNGVRGARGEPMAQALVRSK